MFGLSKRWEMICLLFSGVVVVYALRVNMSVAVQKMKDELNWSTAQKGFALSSFYWGYAIGQVPSSFLAKAYGAKWIFGISVVVPSVLSALVPFCARTSFPMTLAVRCVLGLFESASFPAIFHFLPLWIPIKEKTFLISVICSGMYVGEIIAFSLSGWLVTVKHIDIGGTNFGNWPSVFYLFGVIGVIWFPFWALLAYETPDQHPDITREELDFINEGKEYIPLLADAHGFDAEEDAEYQQQQDLTDVPDSSQEEAGVQTVNPIYTDKSAPASSGSLHHRKKSQSNDQGRADRRYLTYSVSSADGQMVQLVTRKTSQMPLPPTPWGLFFTHPVCLTLFVNAWTFGWVGFLLLSEMPSYLTDQLGFDIQSAGALCIAPYAAMFSFSMGGAHIFTVLEHEHGWSVPKVRQVAQFLAFGGSGVCLVICSFLSQPYASFSFLVLAQGFYGLTASGLLCSYLDACPNYSSILNSTGNTFGACGGIAGPIIVSYLTEAFPGVWGWRLAFLLTCVQCVISLILWRTVITSEVIPELNNPSQALPINSVQSDDSKPWR